MDDLEKLLSGVDAEPEKPSAESPKKDEASKPAEPTEEELNKAEQLDNLNRAIAEAQGQLTDLRNEKKKAKADPEDDIPKINDDDPSSKAWNKRIGESVDPMKAEMEKEKREVRTFALRKFLEDKPRLAKSPEKLRELMGTYEQIRTATERNQEGVLLDLAKAYAATFHEELLTAARQARIEKAESDSMISDIAVSTSASSYQQSQDKDQPLSEEDRAWLSKWGMSPAEWQEAKRKYR